MKLFKRSTPPQPPSDHVQRLAGLRGVAHDEDERPSREDGEYGQTIFTRQPDLLPRALTGGKR